MQSWDIEGSIKELGKSLSGQKLDIFVGQCHNNISYNVGFYAPMALKEEVRALLDSGSAADRLTVAIDTTIGRQDSPDLQALLHSLRREIKSGRVNLVFFRSGVKFDLAGMDNSPGALTSIYNNGDAHWKKFNRSIHSPEAMQGADFQLHTHLQKHAHEDLENYRSAIANQNRSMMKMLPKEMVTSLDTLDAPGAVQVVFSDDAGTQFLHLKPSSALLRVGGYAAEISGAIAQAATRLGMEIICRPSLGFAHTTFTPIDPTRCRMSLGLEDKTKMQILADVFSAANDVGEDAIRTGDPGATRALFSNSDAIMKAYEKAQAQAQTNSAFTRRT